MSDFRSYQGGNLRRNAATILEGYSIVTEDLLPKNVNDHTLRAQHTEFRRLVGADATDAAQKFIPPILRATEGTTTGPASYFRSPALVK